MNERGRRPKEAELERLRAYLEEHAGPLEAEEADRLREHLAGLRRLGIPPVVDPEVPARFEEEIRTTARALLAVHGVSQTKLAEALGVSQSSVSHMLTNRSYGLTTTEVWWVETLAEVRHGTIYEAVSYIDTPALEELVWRVPGINSQAAEAIVAAIRAVTDQVRRESEPK